MFIDFLPSPEYGQVQQAERVSALFAPKDLKLMSTLGALLKHQDLPEPGIVSAYFSQIRQDVLDPFDRFCFDYVPQASLPDVTITIGLKECQRIIQ
ncbi:MAG: hypothetical protein ABSG91_23585 [Syntrophobacteraceae bacterium]|jgi:hypothetical protein